MNTDHQPGLYNVFSNVWLFFGYNNKEHEHILRKIKAMHGITKLISIDDLCKFWITGIGGQNNNGESYNHAIKQQIIIDRRAKLQTIYKQIAGQIDIAIRSNNSESTPVVLGLYTLNPIAFECLIGAYLYYICKRASMTLANSARALTSKISGVEYQMTDEMKQFLFLICSS
jgi:hypothetical protein